MSNIVEEYRVFSRLSGGCNFATIDEKRLMFVGGMCLPLNLGMALLLYVMTGGGAYKATMGKVLDIDALIMLNPADDGMIKCSKTVPWKFIDYLYDQMCAVMREWQPEDYEKAVEEHRMAFHTDLLG